MVFNQSKKKIMGFVTVLILGGITIIGFSIALNPPTNNIPAPDFYYSNLNDLFRYYNDTQGGAVTNFLEFDISFDNVSSL